MATISFQSKVKVNKKEAKKLISIIGKKNNKKPMYASINNQNVKIDNKSFIETLKKSYK